MYELFLKDKKKTSFSVSVNAIKNLSKDQKQRIVELKKEIYIMRKNNY